MPFGYESCWIEESGERRRRCDPEHPGGVHILANEAEAVRELFRRYHRGAATLARLAAWLNDQGLRTRNMHKLKPTSASLRGMNAPATGGPSLRDARLPHAA